jgi:hypothetical protein
LRIERSGSSEIPPDNDNSQLQCPVASSHAAVADRFRRLSIWLVLASCVIAIALDLALNVRFDPQGTSIVEWLIAALLLASRIWWDRTDHHRIADACGTVAVVSLAGMSCGAIAMLELRLGFPLADSTLYDFDHSLGVDGIAIVETLLRQGHWIFWVLAPAYNLTIPIFFAGTVILVFLRARDEAWRATFCFAGTLLTTCLIAMLVPAKGLGVWAPAALLAELPDQAMRTFWPHFDSFYFGSDPVLRLQVIDGVISFPSFHAVMGFLTFAMWRKYILGLLAAGTWLGLMLVATFPGGGHYFVDLLGGFAVWVAWFGWSRRIERRVIRQAATDHRL